MREKELARCYLDNTVTPLLRPLLVKAAAERPADLPRWLAKQALELFRVAAQSPSEVLKWLAAQMREKAPVSNHPARQIVVKENETALAALHAKYSKKIRCLRDELAALKQEHREDLVQITREPSAFSVKIFDLLRRVQTKQQASLTAADLSDVSHWLDEDSSDIDSWLPKNPDVKDFLTPLCFASRQGQTDLVRLLLDRGSTAIDKQSALRGTTPIYVAACYGPLEAAALLLDRGSQAIDTPIIDGNTALHLACFFARADMARLLLDRGSKAIDTVNKYRCTPLVHVLLFQHQKPELTRLLLDRGVDRQGKTDLFIAAALGDTDEVKRILDHDSSDINTADASEWNATPLDISVYNGHRSVSELLLSRGADRRSMTSVYLASALGDADKVSSLLSQDSSEIDTPSEYMMKPTALYVAAFHGDTAVIQALLNAGSKAINVPSSEGFTPLQIAMVTSMVRSDLAATVQLLLNHGNKDLGDLIGWTAIGSNAVYDDEGNLISEVDQTLRAYESAFDGHIRNERGIACVASWPGIYARLFDQILAGGKQGSVSAAVVFLPEKTAHYGKHSSDRCYCEEMYGRTDVEWGCKWFELWRGHVRKAVALGQRLQVYYFEGRKGQGKVASWEACREDAVRRDSFWPRRQAFLSSLPEAEKARLSGLSSRPRDDAAGERPGSERGDAEEALFMASLSASDRAYLEGGEGLGNSQKAEVAWLEREGILYEEVDVRDFAEGSITTPSSNSRKMEQRRPQKARQMDKHKTESEEIRLLLDEINNLKQEHRDDLEQVQRGLREEMEQLTRRHREDLIQITREPSAFSVKIFDLLRRVQTKQQASLTAADLADVSGWLDEDSSDIDSWLPKNPDTKDIYSPLCFASRLGQEALVSLLLDRGSTAIDKPSVVRGTSPLYNASAHAPLETVSLLLDRGSQAINDTSINAACFFGREEVARLLLDRGSKAIDLPNKYTTTPLAQALFYQHQKPDLARLLLDRGADRQGKTDLFIAAALGDTDEVKRILDQDSSHIDTTDTSEWNATPLDISVYNGHRSVSELLLSRGADRRSMTSAYLASALGDADKVSSLLSEDSSEIDTPSEYLLKATPLYVAAYHGDVAVIQALLNAGSKAINVTSSEGLTALQIAIVVSMLRSDMAATVQLLLNHGNSDTAKQTVTDETKKRGIESWLACGSNVVYDDEGNLISEVVQTLRAYESAFDGHIRNERGIACVASWPGIYARLFDQILAGGKQGSVSAAVVFLPEKTAHYGKHSSDRCYCEEMYGRTDVEWGCKWFELWRGHVRKAVALGQRLQVYYFEGRKGQGKVASWEACREDAVRRDSFWPRRQAFLSSLPEAEKARLSGLSSRPRDDAAGERPGSERGDAEEVLFMASLSASDRAYLEGGEGLGNSQKAEVAWLEREGILYEDVDVRDYDPSYE